MIWHKPHKFKAKPLDSEDGHFDSKAEYRRWLELKLLQKAGKIHDLERQVKYPIKINGILICNYIPDFRYFEDEFCIIEDVKGFETPVFKLKKKLFEALYPDLKLLIVK